MANERSRRNRRAAGFTLLELLVVLVILGLLGGLVAPRFLGQADKAKPKTAKVQIENIGASLDMYRLEVGRYPGSDEGLAALSEAPADAANWNGPYMKKAVPKDPWGNEYIYKAPGDHGDYDLYSTGADSAEGGEQLDKDINSWE